MILKGYGEINLPLEHIRPVKGSYIDGSFLRFHLGNAKLVVSTFSDEAWIEKRSSCGTMKKRYCVTTPEERRALSKLFYQEGF